MGEGKAGESPVFHLKIKPIERAGWRKGGAIHHSRFALRSHASRAPGEPDANPGSRSLLYEEVRESVSSFLRVVTVKDKKRKWGGNVVVSFY